MDSRSSQGEALLKPFDPLPSVLPVPPSRSPPCRPLSFEPPAAAVASLDGLDIPRSFLPLILHCTICLRTSTWYNPMHRSLEQHRPFDTVPSLSISSHSTSSEPSSIGTDFFANIVMSPPTDSPCAERVSARLEDPIVAPDDNTPVALPQQSFVSHRQPSSRIQSWIGGGLEGVCTSCHSLRSPGEPGAAPNLIPRPRMNDSKPTLSQHDKKANPLLSDSQFRRNVDSDSLPNRCHPQAIEFTDPPPLRPAPQHSTGSISSSLPKLPPIPSSQLATTGDKAPLSTEPDVSCSRTNPVISAKVSLKSVSSIHRLERTTLPCDVKVLPNLPSQPNPPEAELTQRLPTRTRKKSPPIVVQNLIASRLSTELSTKPEAISSDSSDSLRPEVNHRGTTLRALLREAKIPQPDSNDLTNSSSRRYPTAVDKWQAAMIATPRDHLRPGDFPNWQPYGAADSPFYHHLCALSASSSSLSGKETLFSASVTSLRDSPCADSRSSSPVSEKTPQPEIAYLKRRPSRGRPATSESLVNQKSSELSAALPETGRYLPAASPNDSQEILSGSALAKPRHTPSNISLIARLTHIHPSAGKVDRGFKRRPNTATGATQSSSLVESSPKPGPHGRSTPSPNVAGPSLLPSSLVGSKATSPASRITNVSTYKRPATATCSGTRTELASSFIKEPGFTRPLPIQKPVTTKNPTPYIPTLPTIQGRTRNDLSGLPDDPPQSSFPLRELDIRPYKTISSGSTTSTKLSPVSASPQSSAQTRHASPVQLSQSVPNFFLKTRFPTPKRSAFYAATTLAVTTDQLTDSNLKHPNLEACPWLQPEEFQSKSRNFTMSVLPRPTASTFNPGQKLSVHLKLSNKAKLRKYTSIHILLMGSTTSENALQATTHDFLRQNYLIYPNASEKVKVISNSGDLSEWHLELNLPEYANCACSPGPLPLPSTGTHAAAKVSYSLQLYADRKQLLSTQESMNVSLNVATRAEARFQVTTQSLRAVARKGRIPFAGGYLGSIDELSLYHQVYYQSADRLRIGYQFELQLSSNSFLPPSVAEELSKATSIQVHTLMRLHPQESALKFVDHRSKIVIIPPDEKDGCVKWMIKGFLELKGVSQQMKAVKATLESTPRTPRRPEHPMSSRGMLSSSHGASTLGSGITSPLASSTNHSLQQETERQAKFNNSQLFLVANIEYCPRVLSKPVEISSLIGSELLSPCSLRKIGDEMMKKAVMAEKMKKVQEENFKNDR